MRISNSAYMGVEALARLAKRDTREPCKTQCIADWINRSLSYTESLMAQLRDAGLVVSRRGPGGGYALARPAHRITIAEIFQAFDAPFNSTPYPLDTEALEADEFHDLHGADLLWEALKNYVLSFLSGVSLADLTSEAAEMLNRDAGDGDNDVSINAFGLRSRMHH